MVLREVAPSFEVLGTDLSVERIERARTARYSSWSLRGLPEPVVLRNFRATGKQYVLDPQLSRLVTFRPLNLVSGDYPSLASGIWNMDLVLCRNVLIYLEPEAVASVARRLVDSLSPDGWLLLSASDPPIGDLVACETVVTPAGVAYRRRKAESVIDRGEKSARARADISPPPPRPPRSPVATPPTRLRARARREEPRGDAAPEVTAAELRQRVRSLADRGELASAQQECIAALQRSPFDAEMTCLQAILLLDSGSDGVEAASTARRALYLDRTLILAHLTLAQALSRQADRGGARLALRNAVQLLERLDPDAPVPGAGGETAARLLVAARVQLGLLEQTV
jgi:chemotaxis protein methyltransferase CheR